MWNGTRIGIWVNEQKPKFVFEVYTDDVSLTMQRKGEGIW